MRADLGLVIVLGWESVNWDIFSIEQVVPPRWKANVS